jgi:hypothetical protein
LRIGFFVWEYPPKLVGGLGTYAEYIIREFVELGHDVSVFTLNPGELKTRTAVLFCYWSGTKMVGQFAA